MAYLETIESIQNYVTVLNTFEPRSLTPFKRRANRIYLEPFVGDLYNELSTTPTEAIQLKAHGLFEESLCAFAFFLGNAELSLQIDATGISTHNSPDYSKADNFEKNDFKRGLLRNGHEALDALLKHLQANASVFTSYTDELQDAYNDLLVPDTSTFQEYYNINSSRQTFIALLPTMRQVQDQYISNFLCSDFIETLKTTEVTANVLKVKIAIQKAIVAYTVAQTVFEGQFLLDGNGIHLRFDRLQHETLDNKVNDFLKHTHKSKMNAGAQYLKEASKIITTHPTEFTDCDGNVLIDNTSTSSTSSQIVTNNRIIAL